MDRFWLLTWTTYGTWLAGSDRGFVSNVYAPDGGPEVRHNEPGTEYDSRMPGLENYVKQRMLDEPFRLNEEQARVMIEQFQETSRIRGFELCAASVMFNHTHLLVGVPGDPDPHHLLELYKSWATRAMKKRWQLPKSGRFFTAKGSVRKKEGEEAVRLSVIYVACKQPNPLAVHAGEKWQSVVEAYQASVDASASR